MAPVGERVIHPKWGPGTIVQIQGVGEEALVVVAFPGIGLKTLARGLRPPRQSGRMKMIFA